jgi:putative transposase
VRQKTRGEADAGSLSVRMRTPQEEGSHHPPLTRRVYSSCPRPGQTRLHSRSSGPPVVADITYVRTWEGWLYLSFVLDTYFRKVVGWSIANSLRTGLVLDALNMALYTPRPSPRLIHHSDRGSQYTSVEFSGRLKEAGLAPSMGLVADAYDNSMAESFISTLKRELIHRHSWPNRQTARTSIFEYIEGFYNTRRRHSALGHLSPSEYEEVRLKGGAVA